MESKANYTLVGLVVVVLTMGLVMAMVWLSTGFSKKQYRTYAVYFNEAVSGLGEDSQVKFNGVTVGQVKTIGLNQNNPQQVRVLLDIDTGTPITISTSATLMSQGITGISYIGLSASTPTLELLKTRGKEAYPIIPAKPSMFHQLDSALKEITVTVNRVGRDIQAVFTKPNLENLTTILDNVAKSSTHMPKLIETLQRSVQQVETMATRIGTAGNAGTIAIQRFTQQTLPALYGVLQHLNAVSRNIESASALMRQNPAVIVRGTTPPPKGPGE